MERFIFLFYFPNFMTEDVILKEHLKGLKEASIEVVVATGKFVGFTVHNTAVLAAVVDLALTPPILHIFTGEYKTLHQYLGLPPDMTENQVFFGMFASAAYMAVSSEYVKNCGLKH